MAFHSGSDFIALGAKAGSSTVHMTTRLFAEIESLKPNMSIFAFSPVVFWKSVFVFLNMTYFGKAYLSYFMKSYFMKSYLSVSTTK